MIMTALAKGLPFFFVPEKLRIATVWLDVADDRRRNETAFCFTADTPWVTFQEKFSGLLPFPSIAAPLCTGVHVHHNNFFHRVPSRGSPDICRASSVFLAFFRISGIKKDRRHFATVLYPFLDNSIISYRWDCKQEKLTATLCNPS